MDRFFYLLLSTGLIAAWVESYVNDRFDGLDQYIFGGIAVFALFFGKPKRSVFYEIAPAVNGKRQVKDTDPQYFEVLLSTKASVSVMMVMVFAILGLIYFGHNFYLNYEGVLWSSYSFAAVLGFFLVTSLRANLTNDSGFKHVKIDHESCSFIFNNDVVCEVFWDQCTKIQVFETGSLLFNSGSNGSTAAQEIGFFVRDVPKMKSEKWPFYSKKLQMIYFTTIRPTEIIEAICKFSGFLPKTK
ncbi:MAG: hypothetical protein NT027_10355 [Proteobacteria bacterium]|nr:hypothetical protein [Pseudomonadota bacterium]